MHPAAHPQTELVGTSDLTDQIGRKAANLFRTRQVWCSGAVLLALNGALKGGLTQRVVIQMCAGLGHGMGGSGCLCGGLNGAAIAIGLMLGNGQLSPSGDPTVLSATRRLHRQFKSEHGSTCCRKLIRGLSMGSEAQFKVCAQHTANAASLAAAIIFAYRPALIDQVDRDYLNQLDSQWGARLKIAASRLKS